jgi:hypothetical protein
MATAEFFFILPDNLLQEGGRNAIYFHTRNRREESLAERSVGGNIAIFLKVIIVLIIGVNGTGKATRSKRSHLVRETKRRHSLRFYLTSSCGSGSLIISKAYFLI